MQTENLEGQESIFGRDLGFGKMSSALSQVGGTLKRVKKSLGRIFKKSSKRSSKLKNHTFMLLDLRPGAGNMLGAYWEYDPPWLGSFGIENKLAQYGIHTIGDLAKTSPDTLRHMLGINGLKLWMYANGTDISRVMHKDFVSPVKSIGHGITCTADLQTPEDVFRVMLELSQDVGHRLRVHELMACGVQVSVRTNDLYGSQYQCKLPFRTQLPNEIAGAGFHLLMERYRWDKPIRAVTIRGIDLVSQKEAEQLSMFVDHQKRDRRILLEDAVEDIRRRFGKRAISYAILMGDLKIPDDGRQSVTMPGLMYQ